MHLTLEFLGEILDNRLHLLKEIMDDLEFEPFSLCLTKLGHFKRQEGNVCWIGIEKNNSLLNVHKKLHQALTEKGFELEDREYKPHITIGRKVKLKDGFNASELNDIIGKIKIDINKIDLMKSEFTTGKLIHSVVYSKRLYQK